MCRKLQAFVRMQSRWVTKDRGKGHIVGAGDREIYIEASIAEDLRRSNMRLKSLLQEANHRVVNSLQLVSTLVRTHSSAVADPVARAALKDAQQRIQAIAQVHRLLYDSEGADLVSMKSYLVALVAKLEETWSTPIAPRILSLESDPVSVTAGCALSLGVIINELVSNACKYAYSPTGPGEVRIFLFIEQENHLLLRVEDDGHGLQCYPNYFGAGLGMRMIQALVQSLKATLRYDSTHHGVRAVLSVPL
jgi:two-component sensor histidine kinase